MSRRVDSAQRGNAKSRQVDGGDGKGTEGYRVVSIADCLSPLQTGVACGADTSTSFGRKRSAHNSPPTTCCQLDMRAQSLPSRAPGCINACAAARCDHGKEHGCQTGCGLCRRSPWRPWPAVRPRGAQEGWMEYSPWACDGVCAMREKQKRSDAADGRAAARYGFTPKASW